MRNSSLVEGFCADNVTGLKLAAEAVVLMIFHHWEVGERPACSEAAM